MQVVVDNRQGADDAFVADLRSALEAAGFAVEVRGPRPQSIYDTTVHFIVEGVSVRVPDGVDQGPLQSVIGEVRGALRRRSERQRFRSVPVYRGETNQVLAWVDIFT
jgi:hypothetical protein